MRRFALVLASLLLAFGGVSAHADAIITLDFNDVDVGQFGEITVRGPYIEDGFRVTTTVRPLVAAGVEELYVQDHFDFVCGLPPTDNGCGVDGPSWNLAYDGTVWLGTDVTACRFLDSSGNPTSLGGSVGTHCTPHIRIDRFGDTFSAIDVLSVLGGWTLTSSKGGFVSASTGQTADMTGDLWTGIEWLEFSVSQAVGAPLGIDNLRLKVPEPPALALLLLAVAASGVARRKPSISGR